MPSRKTPPKKNNNPATPLPPPPAPPKMNGQKTVKNTWSGWDANDDYDPAKAFYSEPQLSADAFVQDKDIMPPPEQAVVKANSSNNIIPVSRTRKSDVNPAKGLVKPKGWSSVWGNKAQLEAGYEVYYDVDDIKFGFPTVEEKQNKITSSEAIWNDELFDTEKYQDWEDEWAEYDLKKGTLTPYAA